MDQLNRMSRNEQGFSLIETIIAAGVLAVILMAAAQLNGVMVSQSAQMVSLSVIELYRAKIVQAVQDDSAWRRTVFENRTGSPAISMRCLYRLADTCNQTFFNAVNNRTFALYNASGLDDETYFDAGGPVPGPIYSSQGTGGFNLRGRKCNGFNANFPTPNCPLRFNLRWYSPFPGSSPQIYIYGLFV